jgi:hypothetical protein
MSTYTLNLTKEQLRAVEEAAEVYARLTMGQKEYAIKRTVEHDNWELGKIVWDIYQVIRHQLSWEYAVETGKVESMDSQRKWPEMMAVSYDEPLKTGKEPLCTVEKVE